MTLQQALIIAALQGATELFPVSSLGHAVLLPALLGWGADLRSPAFLPFLVFLHLGTAAALLIYFWRDWLNFAAAVIGIGDASTVATERKMFVNVVVATIPAVIIGFSLEHFLRGLFASPIVAAMFLVANGVILFAGERLYRGRQRKTATARPLSEIGWATSMLIGACQALALIPGISRSGTTIVGGMVAGLSHKDAARFSFLIATPVILGAGVLEVPKLMHAGTGAVDPTVLYAGIVAGITAFVSTAFLMRYLKQAESAAALNPFAIYCWVVGGASIFFFATRAMASKLATPTMAINAFPTTIALVSITLALGFVVCAVIWRWSHLQRKKRTSA